MSVAQTQAKRSREIFWAVEAGMSPLTPALKTLGKSAGDAYHVRRLDACPNRAGRFPEDAHHVRQPKHTKTSRQMFWATDTCRCLHTFS